MREILFRGKCGYRNEWVEGFYYQAKLCRTDKELCHYITIPHPDCDGQPSDHIMVDPATLGQFTGLTDKNGKKIFEGDILHFKAYQGGGFVCPIGTDIYYRVLCGCCNPRMNTLSEYVGFWALGKNYNEDDLYKYGNSIGYLVNSHGACVIGNIHDNPELLEPPKGE